MAILASIPNAYGLESNYVKIVSSNYDGENKEQLVHFHLKTGQSGKSVPMAIPDTFSISLDPNWPQQAWEASGKVLVDEQDYDDGDSEQFTQEMVEAFKGNYASKGYIATPQEYQALLGEGVGIAATLYSFLKRWIVDHTDLTMDDIEDTI